MRILTPLPFLMLLVSGCTAEDSEKEFTALRSSGGTPAALCDAAQKVEIEWRKRGDERRIAHWSMMREMTCSHAGFCRQNISGCT